MSERRPTLCSSGRHTMPYGATVAEAFRKEAAWGALLPIISGAGRLLAGAGARSALKTVGTSALQGAAMQTGANIVSKFGRPSATPRQPAPVSPAPAPQPFNTTI